MNAPVFFSSAVGSHVNREAGIIEGVSVITEGKAKGHGILIDRTTLEQVKACAEQFSDGVQVKVNHGTGFDSIVGVLRNFRIDGQKLIADLHLLKNHEMRDRLFEIAEEMPGSIGLSISFSGADETIEKKKYARCSELYSVDFVDRPAANPSGLFCRVDSPAQGMADDTVAPEKKFFDHVRAFFGAEPAAPVNFETKAKELETKLTEANAKITELSPLQAKVIELEAAKAKADTDLTTANAKLATFDAEVEKQASAKALQITAGQGQPPVTPPANPNTPAPAAKELKGFERVVAAFKAQSAEKALTK